MSGGWRYQPVYVVEDEQKVFSLCELYFDDDGRLSQWTERSAIEPKGFTLDDLQGDLVHMLMDAWKWVPVEFSKLKVGMVLQRAITQESSEALAELIERTSHNMGQITSVSDTSKGGG